MQVEVPDHRELEGRIGGPGVIGVPSFADCYDIEEVED